jgi:hypothetical protein
MDPGIFGEKEKRIERWLEKKTHVSNGNDIWLKPGKNIKKK